MPRGVWPPMRIKKQCSATRCQCISARGESEESVPGLMLVIAILPYTQTEIASKSHSRKTISTRDLLKSMPFPGAKPTRPNLDPTLDPLICVFSHRADPRYVSKIDRTSAASRVPESRCGPGLASQPCVCVCRVCRSVSRSGRPSSFVIC